MGVLVVGSFIVDLVATTKKAPEAGETVIGDSYNNYHGGKGANQAVISARMGSKTTMVGSVGSDTFGKSFINLLKKETIDTSLIKISEKNPTGVSLIIVEKNGQNRICMTPGANMDYEVSDLLKIEDKIADSNVIVSQFEIKEEVTNKLIELAAKYHKTLIINPAPARKIKDEDYKNITIITPNEKEIEILSGRKLISIKDYEKASEELIEKGVKHVIVTLGSLGSLYSKKGYHKFIPSFKVKPLDTVGAGDSFTGSLASFIDQGYEIEEALVYSTAVGALSVLKKGAIPSMPYKNEVFSFLEERGIKCTIK